MKPWITLASVIAPGGSTLSLVKRDDTFVIRVDKQELMTSRTHGSEEALAQLTCESLGPKARILIGGLGMGYTLRTALDRLHSSARIDVAEFAPAVVEWNRGPLAHLAKRPLEDRRVTVLIEDVARVIARSPATYDAILLDTDNGPMALTAPGNANLYGEPALLRTKAALTQGGVLAIWSAGESRAFHKRLENVGYDVRVRHVPARGDRGGNHHIIWLARSPSADGARKENSADRAERATATRRGRAR